MNLADSNDTVHAECENGDDRTLCGDALEGECGKYQRINTNEKYST